MSNNCSCGEKGKEVLIYACSGASAVGQLANDTALTLRERGFGSMLCLAALGGKVKPYLDKAAKADINVVIDGCPVGCGKAIFTEIGITPDIYAELSQYGFKKTELSGPVQDAWVEKAVDAVSGELCK